MNLAVCVTFGGENGTNECHLTAFSEDVAFTHHFVASCPPSMVPPLKNASGIGYTSKKLSKWQAIHLYPVYSRHNKLS